MDNKHVSGVVCQFVEGVVCQFVPKLLTAIGLTAYTLWVKTHSLM